MSFAGSAITTPSSFSASCLIMTTPGCSKQNLSMDNYGLPFCGNADNASRLFSSPKFPINPALIPMDLNCNATIQCINQTKYYCECFPDPVVGRNCTAAGFLSDSDPLPGNAVSRWFGALAEDPVKFGFTIAGMVLGGLCIMAIIWFCMSGGKTIGPKGYASYKKDRKHKREERHRKRLLAQEKHLDEKARAYATSVRTKQEFLTVEAERLAKRALEEEDLKIAMEEEMDKLTQESHDMMIKDMKRKDELINMAENTTDDQLKRKFEREMLAISMRSEKREEEVKTSSNFVKWTEKIVVEDGRVVDHRKELQRERYARTNREAQKLMGSVGPDLERIQNQQQNYGSGSNTQNSAGHRLNDAKML
ncbi:hypothetical protein CcCBS67573_g07527 [Chytriomyces confervae]|uniref:Uncharacterized protein n=1 Tax=Chytriomyces confervae TaxID=246404 RepID=A0A507EVW7_9FUNG|nr:hypothetical protein CcCBS67573_g07527 [Chytriomyces confervae]